MTGTSFEQNPEQKIIVLCDHCYQKLSIPKRKQKITIRCPACKHEFSYTYNRLGLSPNSGKQALVGLVGGVAGFMLSEVIEYILGNGPLAGKVTDPFLATTLVLAAYAAGLGAILSAGESYFRRDRARMLYGLRIGALLGLASGAISGLLAEFVYVFVLSASSTPDPSLGLQIFARALGWSILGALIGAAYGVRENTRGDLKFGLIGGAIGGLLGGLLFDPIGSILPQDGGIYGRLIGFTLMGLGISVAISHFRQIAITNNNPDMYLALSDRIPVNPRLLPGGSSSVSKN
jgi:hypothetical protein